MSSAWSRCWWCAGRRDPPAGDAMDRHAGFEQRRRPVRPQRVRVREPLRDASGQRARAHQLVHGLPLRAARAAARPGSGQAGRTAAARHPARGRGPAGARPAMPPAPPAWLPAPGLRVRVALAAHEQPQMAVVGARPPQILGDQAAQLGGAQPAVTGRRFTRPRAREAQPRGELPHAERRARRSSAAAPSPGRSAAHLRNRPFRVTLTGRWDDTVSRVTRREQRVDGGEPRQSGAYRGVHTRGMSS